MALDAKGVMFAEVFRRRPVLVTVKPGAAKR
jgi:hypothetical protein